MTYDPMADLKEFHDKFHQFGTHRNMVPIGVSDIDRRSRLITEEFLEVDEELLALSVDAEMHRGISDYVQDYSKLAKELADLLYVVYGTAEEFGIPLEAVFATVHESNMSKVWDDGEVHYNEFGKVIKPPTYIA